MKKLLVMLCGVMLLAVSGCCSMGQCKITMEKNAVLLDVRTPAEYQKGYLQGAINLPQADVDTKAATVVPTKDTPVYVYCRGGREATMVEVNKTKRQNSPTLKNSQKFVKWGQWFNTRSNSEKIINFEITDFSMYGDFLPKIDARFL